jgi:hypothetical protein
MPTVPGKRASDGIPNHQAPVPGFKRTSVPEVEIPTDEILLERAHEQNLEDTSRLVKLSTELKEDLANHDREVLSMSTVKKMDEIERLIRKIRNRGTRKK